jgi:hypothetical protein
MRADKESGNLTLAKKTSTKSSTYYGMFENNRQVSEVSDEATYPQENILTGLPATNPD